MCEVVLLCGPSRVNEAGKLAVTNTTFAFSLKDIP